MARFSHLAPEEIAGAALLVVAIFLVALRPAPVVRLFETPFATPSPGGGPARQLVRETHVAPRPVLLFERRRSP